MYIYTYIYKARCRFDIQLYSLRSFIELPDFLLVIVKGWLKPFWLKLVRCRFANCYYSAVFFVQYLCIH